MYKKAKIVFATDFSPSATIALEILKLLHQTYQLEIYFLFVIVSMWKDWVSSGMLEKEVSERLAILQAQVTHPPQVDPTHIIVDKGHGAKIITKVANDVEAQLILMGTGGGKKSKYSIGNTGSIATNVVRLAKQSVWLCHNLTISKLLCGIDGSTQSAKALRQAIQLAKQFNAKLSVVSTIPAVPINPLGLDNKEISAIEERFKCKHIEDINVMLKVFEFKNISVDFHFPWGSPGNTLVNIAHDLKCDLIVLGATGSSQIKELLLGSTADKVLNQAPCSLLVVR